MEESPKPNKMIIFEDGDYLSRTLDSLNKLRKHKKFCDVILQIGSDLDVHEIHAHRVVLASASPYLFELFGTDTHNSHVCQYKLNGTFDVSAFQNLVDYAYTARLEIPPEKVKTVYMTAKKLKMNAVAKQCGTFLLNTLNPSNCIGIRSIPMLTFDTEMLKKVDSYIRMNVNEVIKSKELLALPQIPVELLQSTSEEIQATNEQHLCEMVLDWVKKSFDDDKLNVLSEKVHLLYLNEDHSLHDCNDIENGEMQDSDLIQDYKKLSRRLSTPSGKNGTKKGVITPAKPRNFLFTRDESVSPNAPDELDEKKWKLIATTTPGGHSIMGIAILAGNLGVLSIVQRLNTPSNSPGGSRNSSVEKANTYSLVPPMSSARCAVGTGDLQGKLFVCGGYDRGECLKTVESYDQLTNRWTTLKPMKIPRGRFDIAVVEDKVYAIGGSDGSKELNTAEVLDSSTMVWKQLPNLPVVRSNAGVCNLESKIYVVGGWNGKRGIMRCDVYDPQSASWSEIAPLLTGRYQAGAAAMMNEVYAVGGCDSWSCLSSVEKYTPSTDTWALVAPTNTPRRGCGVAVYNGKLYAVGGHDGVKSLCTVEIYDYQTNTWSSGPSLTSCRANVGVTVVGNRLYAVGGFNGKAFLNTVEFLDSQTNAWTTFVTKGNLANGCAIPIIDKENCGTASP